MIMAQLHMMIAVLIILFFPHTIVNSQSEPVLANYNCTISGDTFKENSTFLQNLDVVLGNLTTSASTLELSFSNTSFGQTSDKVYGLYLCRGDLTAKDCSRCIANATESTKKLCPNQKEAILWFHECVLRYANRNIFSREEESPSYTWIPVSTFSLMPPAPSPSSARVGFNLSNVVYALINDTAYGIANTSTTSSFATRQDNITGGWNSLVLYSLAQCTPDLSQTSCHNCLTKAYTSLRSCCSSSIQALSYLPSCQLRYDTQQFLLSRITQPSPSQGGEDQKSHSKSFPIVAKIIIPMASVILLLIGLCTLILINSGFCVIRSNKKSNQGCTAGLITMESLQYDLNVMKSATVDFGTDNKLGQGGFGVVYKGRLQDGQEIAVKRLSPKSRQGIHEFKTEVVLVAKLQHKNLVRLLGFCATEQEKLLVYEFLPNSSLDFHLFDPEKRGSLDWDTRFKIIDGIAKGLLYLHQDSRLKVVHRDLKPSNVLLDKDMCPKISDFGMAKLFGDDEPLDMSMKIAGTRGYMAPEYLRSGQISVKSDVYSFGVLILEIVSGCSVRDSLSQALKGNENLLERAWRLWHSNDAAAFVDCTLCNNFSSEEALRCIHIGVSCIQEDADKRPTIGSIVCVLNSHSTILPQLAQDGYYKSENSSSSDRLFQSNSMYTGIEEITTLSGR